MECLDLLLISDLAPHYCCSHSGDNILMLQDRTGEAKDGKSAQINPSLADIDTEGKYPTRR